MIKVAANGNDLNQIGLEDKDQCNFRLRETTCQQHIARIWIAMVAGVPRYTPARLSFRPTYTVGG
jgi:hypothetical protein